MGESVAGLTAQRGARTGTASPCPSGTACAVDTLGRGREFTFFLGPFRRFLFFRRQGRFLLGFLLLFEFFGHGIRSSSLHGVHGVLRSNALLYRVVGLPVLIYPW